MPQPWDSNGPARATFKAAEARWLEHWGRGPTRLTWTELPVQRGEPAPVVELIDTNGRSARLLKTWATKPALLLFWRHWGCGVGRAELLREQLPVLVAAGANVVVIGQGEPERGAWYAEAFGIPVPILLDPSGAAYEAFSLHEMSPWLLLGEPKPPMPEFESQIPEHREKGRPVADNPFLLPGEFVVDTRGELVVDTRGELVLTYRYQYCDNYPDVDSLVDSIHEAAAG